MSSSYVYLTSAPHSGSTMLACLLAVHPEITSIGEFTSEWPREGRICSCGAQYPACPVWSRWAELAAAAHIELDIKKPELNLEPRQEAGFFEDLYFFSFGSTLLNRLRDMAYAPVSNWPRHTKATAARAVALAELLCREQHTSVFFDTSKNPLQIRFLAGATKQLKVVSLIRDGRGVMQSVMKHYKRTPDQAIDVWLWSIRNQQRVLATYVNPDQIFECKLEDFCVTPDDHLARLYRFLGVAPDLALDYADPSRRHVTGNKMRMSFDGKIRGDESWRQTLTSVHLKLFEARAGALNRSLGYLD